MKEIRSYEIEAIMSAKVAEYISKGYILSTTTMSGHQGEIAKVDVKKDDEIIRILLTGESDLDDEGTVYKVTLTVGRAQDKVRRHSPFDTMATTIWNNRLDTIEETVWYSVDRNADCFSTDKAEIIAQHKKQIERYRNREDNHGAVELSDKAKEIVLPFIRKQRGFKSAKVTDIMTVHRHLADKWDGMHYVIRMTNGKTFKLA